jgi:histidinol-phosphate aminotransferase
MQANSQSVDMGDQFTTSRDSLSDVAVDDVCLLDRNECVQSPDARVLAALSRELSTLNRYPDPHCGELRSRIADQHGVGPEEVIVGNGVDELLLLFSLGLLGPDRVAVVTERTFPGHRTSCSLSGADVRAVPLDGYHVDAVAVADAVSEGADVAVVCNPHNPTGTVLIRTELERLVERCTQTGCTLIVDEAYIEFDDSAMASVTDLVSSTGRLVVLRTFSKMMGLAGLRIGYAIGPAATIARVLRAKAAVPFSVNRLAQTAALAVLEDDRVVDQRRDLVRDARAYLCRLLDSHGIDHVPSAANFVLVRLPASLDSSEIAERLRRDCAVHVRDTTAFGFPGHLRVTIGTPTQMDRFARGLATLLSRR